MCWVYLTINKGKKTYYISLCRELVENALGTGKWRSYAGR